MKQPLGGMALYVCNDPSTYIAKLMGCPIFYLCYFQDHDKLAKGAVYFLES